MGAATCMWLPPVGRTLLLLACLASLSAAQQDYDANSNNYNKYDTNNNNNPYSSTDSNDLYNRDNQYTNPSSQFPANRYGDGQNPPRFGSNDPTNPRFGSDSAARFGSGLDPSNRFNPDGSTRYGSGDSLSSSAARNPFESSAPTRNRNVSPYTGRLGGFFTDTNNNVHHEPTYFIVASRMVRPGQVYKVAVQVLSTKQPIAVRASIARDGVEMSHDSQEVKEGIPETLLMRVPTTSSPGTYKLRVEGIYSQAFGGVAFLNETKLTFSQRSMTIFVQTDKPTYMQGETVRFRTIPITTALRGYDSAIDVYMLDPNGHILRRWLSRQSNLGTVSLQYQLSDQPVYGEWTIRVSAQGQIEEHKYMVEEYYQTRYEVNVTMPAFFFNTDPYIHGRIMANFTSGAPVRGNLTIKATIRPIGYFNTRVVNHRYRVGNTGPLNLPDHHVNEEYLRNLEQRGSNFNNQDGQDPRYQQPGPQGQVGGGYGSDYYPQERHFNFDEEWPFWVRKPETSQEWDPWSKTYTYRLPYLRYFNGTYEFKYPMSEIATMLPQAQGLEVLITATVGEKFYDEVISGYSVSRIYNSSIKVSFLGGSPQVFKPAMPFMCYISAEYHDGSAIPFDDYYRGTVEISGFVESKSGGRREYPLRVLRMSERLGIWELKVDLRNELGIGSDRTGEDFLQKVDKMQLVVNYMDERGERAVNEVRLVAHVSPRDRHIKVSTSTAKAKVGEYVVLHVQTNYFTESFNYMLLSKGIVLLTGQENMQEGIRTMAITLSAEMAPVSTVVVWHIAEHGQIVADSLTFPVNGISRNKFQVLINNRKARTGEKVEVAVYGEPGAYVGLSGIDNAFYTMQAGNELTYAKVITKMSTFDEQTNGTLKQTWYSHEGNPDELVYYPSSSYGIDANRTFEYSGLVVFTDGIVPRRNAYCNESAGYGECLSGQCYPLERKCDGVPDCEDGVDEINCNYNNFTTVAEFRKFRFNRIRRHYENVWLWRDINIGPHGRYIFNVEVPEIPALWMVSAFSVSPTMGFGMIKKAIEYVGVQPFFINVEMPTECRQGEQVGIRVTVFNYQETAIEATVVLHGSSDYKFVHVGANGIVRSYNPDTSFGEHQFFIYLEAQATSTVYLPIVPQRLGDIDVTVHGQTLLGSDIITRRLHVEADGIPQYRHQSILLDLSNRAYVFQYMHINVTETPIIPYDVDRYFVFGSNKARISVVGDVVGPIFPTMPVNATSMLYLPMDAAEQNMFSFAANLYTIMYMRLINQRNKHTERDAFYHMNVGYQRQLSFMRADGSFSLFRSDWNSSASSVWLTAYCARMFQEASFYEWENYIYIDPKVIQKAIRYVLKHQTVDGAFYEVTWSSDRKVNGSLNMPLDHDKYRNISLTAHVLITLTTVKDLSGNLGGKVSNAQQRAVMWLDRNLKVIKEAGNPYEVALVAYALMLAKAPIAEQAFGILTSHARTIGDLMYWGNEEVPAPPTKMENQKYFSLPRLPYEYDSLNIETTAYALLTYVSRRELLVEPIVRWLTAQRLNDGGWASTSDTSVAMKALIEYTVRSRIRDVSQLAITVEATSLPGNTKTLHITDKNLAQLQTIEIPNAWGTVKVQAKGAGYAILQMHVQYNVDIAKFQTQPPVNSFELITNPLFSGRNQSHITFSSCQRWTRMNESIRSGMAVLDVAIPTGYWIQQQKLDSYVLSKRVRNLQRARYQEKKVLFYFDYLDHEQICVNFTVERWYPVANMSRYLPIRVYDYYAPERFNETIVDAIPTYLLNICEVCGSSQCPYCSIYNAAALPTASLMLVLATVLVAAMQMPRMALWDGGMDVRRLDRIRPLA